jgi:hypothetical protein
MSNNTNTTNCWVRSGNVLQKKVDDDLLILQDVFGTWTKYRCSCGKDCLTLNGYEQHRRTKHA